MLRLYRCETLDRIRGRGVCFDDGRRVATCRGVRRGERRSGRRGRRYLAGYRWLVYRLVRRRGGGGISGLVRVRVRVRVGVGVRVRVRVGLGLEQELALEFELVPELAG